MLPQVANAVAVTESDVNVTTPDGTADCYFVHPASGTAPGVLIWPDIFGLRPAFRQMGKRLAESGYSVLVVNPFYRTKKAPTAPAGAATADRRGAAARAGAQRNDAHDRRQGVHRLARSAAVGREEPEGRHAGLLHGRPDGIPHGRSGPDRVGAVASFHGGGLVTDTPNSPHLQAAKTKAQFLIAIAANDDMRVAEREESAEGDVRQGGAAGGDRGLRGRRARLVPARLRRLQRAAGREGLESIAGGLREGAGVKLGVLTTAVPDKPRHRRSYLELRVRSRTCSGVAGARLFTRRRDVLGASLLEDLLRVADLLRRCAVHG